MSDGADWQDMLSGRNRSMSEQFEKTPKMRSSMARYLDAGGRNEDRYAGLSKTSGTEMARKLALFAVAVSEKPRTSLMTAFQADTQASTSAELSELNSDEPDSTLRGGDDLDGEEWVKVDRDGSNRF